MAFLSLMKEKNQDGHKEKLLANFNPGIKNRLIGTNGQNYPSWFVCVSLIDIMNNFISILYLLLYGKHV